MAEGHGRDRWSRTALVCTLIANANRDPKKGRAFRVEDFDPYARGAAANDVIEVDTESIGTLKQAFSSFKGKRK